MTYTASQTAFVSALQSAAAAGEISDLCNANELIKVANSIGKACIPLWVRRNESLKAGRGLWNIKPLLDGDQKINPLDVPQSYAPAPAATPAPAVKSAPTIPTAPSAPVSTEFTNTTLVPSKMDTYVPWGHHTDIETILKSGHFAPIFVTGLSGNGKTTMIEQACARLKREFYRVNITAQTDEDDLLGGFRLIDGNTVWCDGPVIRAMKAGGVLLLDEIDLGGHLMMCLQPVLEGKGVYVKKINEWVQPAAGFTILATANTKGQGDDTGKFSGTGMMNEAMLDRFHFTMEQPYATASTERKILLKNMSKWNMDIAKDGDNYQFADMLTKWADTIRQTFLQGGCSEIITTRRLERIVEAFAIFGDRMKAIKMSVARFDEETQSDFTRLYEKIDVNVSIPEETTTTGPLNVENNECPY